MIFTMQYLLKNKNTNNIDQHSLKYTATLHIYESIVKRVVRLISDLYNAIFIEK